MNNLPRRLYRSRYRIFTFALCVALGWAVPAAAYIMPAEGLAQLWGDRRAAGWREASVRVAVQVGDANAPTTDARIYLKRPERLRWQPADRHALAWLAVDGRQSFGRADVLQGEWHESSPLWLAWLLPRGRKGDDVAPRLLEVLKRFGINSGITSLARFEGGIVTIIGAMPGQLAPPQIWLDKTTLLPVRTLIEVPAAEIAWLSGQDPAAPNDTQMPAAKRRQLDTRLLGWGNGPGGERMPTAWEFWVGEHRLARWEVRHAKTDARLSDKLFSWHSLDRQSGQSSGRGKR